ncbi:MAG: flagellar export protein FliJ [gamma proteobacterium endosymbiont of Lamellibrachia anaximandri]|uniref:Flagellar FliJ protein n=1 Tax=endosymbiont of Lamellibrachia luymesi TaxID=2200907 RepID=A0A370DG03_9GAMM|nr:flagellar export protein FliJ [gamma proteobacterium endosymbiont of Lamellibrachia anaximandri]MBL3619409.1 flagellar export protein FliJ [gamma proteobacterium endosymbiont of Lamellibrachia anaximandri]RDH83480.1 MAG: flagellar export protein FliJ [endosymbiont of Lamellibrachia luymesi]RDH91253.1 MAG: flagellar export protein FliJ [endosymbiont of Seepiophila jonesi]
MSPSKRLKPVQRVAKSREQTAARQLGRSKKSLHEEETKLTQLRQYHQEYLTRFEQAASKGITAVHLQEYRAFIAKLDEAIKQQESVVAASKQNHSVKKDTWRSKHTRTEALSKVVDRYERAEKKEEERSEQKESDDRSQRRPD